jgi:hypothetical protein
MHGVQPDVEDSGRGQGRNDYNAAGARLDDWQDLTPPLGPEYISLFLADT